MIFLVRHGPTEMNLQGRIQGQGDAPLTDAGRDLATRTAQKLAVCIGDGQALILTSPLGRARQTAFIIAETLNGQTDVLEDSRLSEVNLGDWDGLTVTEIDNEWAGVRRSVPPGEWFFIAPNGESFESLRDRNAAFLEELSRLDAENKIIVTHGVSGRALRGVHAGLSRDATVNLPVPSEGFFILHNKGEIEEVNLS